MIAVRRQLTFATLDEAVRDAESLLAKGYDKAGNWDLAQCCHHLATLMTWPIDGFPRMPFAMNVATWLLKMTLASRWLNKVLASGVWPTGTPTDNRTIPTAGGNDADAVAELKQAIERLQRHTGEFKPSPLFGMLDKDTLVKLHCIHTAHHLSFLVPKQ